jgi:flavin reductase (DIM6/NTAB) family NADH-FMN oxidoreductase RutF
MKLELSESARAVALLPHTQFVMSAQHENRRGGVLVRWVCACADAPLMVSVALRKGHWIVPLIRDSRCFALSRVESCDRLALKKFAETTRARDGDPFDAFGAQRLKTGAPVLPRSSLVLDCEVSRHLDLEADHELYVGQVVAARLPAPLPMPVMHAS